MDDAGTKHVDGSLTGWRAVVGELLPAHEVMGDRAAADAEWQPDEPGVYCWRCGSGAGPGEVTATGCSRCRDDRVAWDHLWRLGAYGEPINHWVCAMKFRRQWQWAEWFGRQLAQQVRLSGPRDRMLVTWVPLHLTRRLRRGFDQAGLMARIFARHTGLPLVPTLRRRRRTAPQSTLHANDARQRNVRDAFAARRIDLTDWHIVLIDDVKTSGATLTQCCRLLRNQGAARIDAAVATVADPKRADFAHE